jgi:hypothetical protein
LGEYPKTGYVGVCEVLGKAAWYDEFKTDEMTLNGVYQPVNEFWEDNADYFVSVRWLKYVTEVGFFGNQNSIARPRTPKWGHAVESLKKIWNIGS